MEITEMLRVAEKRAQRLKAELARQQRVLRRAEIRREDADRAIQRDQALLDADVEEQFELRNTFGLDPAD